MPHQCVRCNKFYDDGDQVILKGCACGGRLFFFIRKEKLEKLKAAVNEVLPSSLADREAMEEDVLAIMDREKEEEPVVLDVEAIRLVRPGKYEIDLVHLFKGEPIIFKVEDGKYIIDIPGTFDRLVKKK